MTSVPPTALDLDALRRWLPDHVDGADDAPLESELLVGGLSNLTFVISQGDREWVLRRPPLGHVLRSAHDMAREYTVQEALQPTPVPVPTVYASCDDPDVIGAPFYVMERIDGAVLRDTADLATLSDADATLASRHLADTLAAIHAVDWRAVGLERFGRPEGYLERQITRWTQQWEKSRTRELPGIDELARRLAANLPSTPESTIVHGDFRLDNMMFSRSEDLRPAAVLDWEMSTIGDPLADLGLLMVYWPDPDDRYPAASVAPKLSAGSGFLSRAELAADYSRTSGRDISELPFYMVLGYFKLAIILEGIHRRHTMGQTLGAGFEQVGEEVPRLVETALAVADDHGLST